MTRFEPIRGGYVHVESGGEQYRIYYEEAGEGAPLLCLHTAGCDSRQWRHLLNDASVTSRFRVIAFDMPYHGRSNPPKNWWLKKYELSVASYAAMVRSVWQAFGLERPVILGCSIGGYIILRLARDFPDELRGVIGLQTVAKTMGRYNDFLHHPAISSEFVACYTYGLNSPNTPEENRRENWWYYAQGGPGVYSGDTAFGRGFDMLDDLKHIDTSRCKVSILSGEYDYAALPEVSRQVAAGIPGARFTFMPGMGHFPIIEDYPQLMKYMAADLEYMLA